MSNTYQTAGCEHFGISSVVNPTNITYRWLVVDPANPGMLISNSTSVSIPAPVWTDAPPANPVLPPVVQAVIQAPPAPVPWVFGDAQWVKVYKTEQRDNVDLDQLMGDNHVVVPEAARANRMSSTSLSRNVGPTSRAKLCIGHLPATDTGACTCS
jgi:hypothetical protein